MLTALRRIVEAPEDKKGKPVETLVELRELFDQGRIVAVLTHPAELAKLRAKIVSLKNDLEFKKLELQTFPGLFKEVARLGEEVKKVRTEALAFNVPLQSPEALQTKDAAVRDHVASLLSVANSATNWNKSVHSAIPQKVIDVDLLKEWESGFKRDLNELKAEVSSLKVERVSLRWAREELDVKMAKLGKDLGSVLQAVLQLSVEGGASGAGFRRLVDEEIETSQGGFPPLSCEIVE